LPVLKQKFEDLARLDPMTGVCNRSVLATDLPPIVAKGHVAVHAISITSRRPTTSSAIPSAMRS
jgi:hypothetical protein